MNTSTTTSNGTTIELDRDGELVGLIVSGTDADEGQRELQLSRDKLNELLESGKLEDILG